MARAEMARFGPPSPPGDLSAAILAVVQGAFGDWDSVAREARTQGVTTAELLTARLAEAVAGWLAGGLAPDAGAARGGLRAEAVRAVWPLAGVGPDDAVTLACRIPAMLHLGLIEEAGRSGRTLGEVLAARLPGLARPEPGRAS